MVPVTALYAALTALLFVALSANVIRERYRGRVSVGDGGKEAMIKAMRTHANCAEYAPIALLLLLIAEVQGAPVLLLHALGLTLLVGRIIHAVGFGRTPQIIPMRRAGMVMTFTAIIVAALTNLILGL